MANKICVWLDAEFLAQMGEAKKAHDEAMQKYADILPMSVTSADKEHYRRKLNDAVSNMVTYGRAVVDSAIEQGSLLSK